MGKLKRIQELEEEIKKLKKYGTVHDEIISYLDTLAKMPEDAVLLYTLSGMQIQHSIGKSARVLREKIYG